MKRLLPLAILALALEGCPSKQDIATASAVPGYNILAQAVLDRNASHPFTVAQKAVAKEADNRAFVLAVKLNGDQLQRAIDLHGLVQGL